MCLCVCVLQYGWCVCVFRYGRVNYVLAQRLELLQEVSRLQVSLGVAGDMSYTCETAGYFYIYQVCTSSLTHLASYFYMYQVCTSSLTSLDISTSTRSAPHSLTSLAISTSTRSA